MRRSGRWKGQTPAPARTVADDRLVSLGHELQRLRRRCRRLHATDWASWSSTVEETNSLAQRISHMEPRTLAGLLVRYEALAWLLVEADDVIMDTRACSSFIAFGRALKRLAAGPDRS